MDTSANDILAVLHRVCLTYPDHDAVVENGSRAISYRQLWEKALRMAAYLSSQPSDSCFVGLSLLKSAAYVVSMIGCWMAGKAFVPIGLDLPVARRKFILEHADIDVCVDEDAYETAMHCSMAETVVRNQAEDPAYMIYSSGTTGTPKGILVGHAGLCNLARCQREMFAVDHQSRYLFFLSTNFDASVSDILVTLTSGASLVIEQMSREELASALYEIIDSRKVTHTDIPPSLLKLLAPDRCPGCLQTIVIGGEAADIDTVKAWSQKVRLINVYGPTEATVCTSMCRCDAHWRMPLLGQVLDNTSYKVYADGRMDATDGELWISGIGLAIGYFKNDELTRKKFPVVNGVRYYRTSDHVRVVDGHELLFVGRIDRQVKLHGQLVELEEIEQTLLKNRNVASAAVVKRKMGEDNDRNAIIAFIQPTDSLVDASELERELRQSCKHGLPKWMMPSLFEFVDQMPLTPTGKINLHELETRTLVLKAERREHAYSSSEEETIARAMANVLKVAALAPDDDFWLLGGDSLLALLLLAMLQKQGINVNPAQLRQASNPRELARLHRQKLSMCIHSSELESEWQMSFLAGTLMSRAGSDDGTILITGATGFLGSHLVSELLTRNTGCTMKCLVRCTSPEAGMKRVCDSFMRYGLDTKLLERVEIVSGDVSQPCLGLPADVYERLSREVDCVWHCAASVNMLAGYDALKDTNVEGTRNIICFCLTGRRKRLHYASTLSVFVSTDRNSGVAYEHDRLDAPTYIYGGYGQTKYVAEKLAIQLADSRQCEVFIYRFGLLCGDTSKGISAPKDFLGMFFRGARTVGALPYDRSHAMAVDISPVDCATQMMVDIAMGSRPGIYHIASENPLPYNSLCDMMIEEGVISQTVDYAEWQQMAGRYDDNADVQALNMALCRMDAEMFGRMRYMDLFQTTNIRFDMCNTHAATNKRCRQNKELVRLYIRRANETV